MATDVDAVPTAATNGGRARLGDGPSAVGPEIPTAMRWGATSLAILAAMTIDPTPRAVGASAVAIINAALRTAFPIRASLPPLRLAVACVAEMTISLVALAIGGGWHSPLLLLLGTAALTAGLVGGARCVAADTAAVGGAAVVSIALSGQAAHAGEATICVALVGIVGAYGRRLQDAAILRVARESRMRSALSERERIARELHDRVGQSVAMAALALDRLAERWSASEGDATGLAVELHELAEEVRGANKEVRTALHELSVPRRGEEIGPALTALVRRIAARGGVHPLLELDDDGSLADDVAEDLFQIAKEALTNVERHAGASSVTARLVVRRGRARLEVADDGAGLANDALEGLGIASIRSRASSIGASAAIRSTGRGVSVEVVLPGPAQ